MVVTSDIASGTEELKFESRCHWADQIARSVVNGRSLLRRSFEQSCVAQAQAAKVGPAHSLRA